jgi:hypothetical protein
MLLGEWEYSLKTPPAQAEKELQQLLNPPGVNTGD